MSDQPDEERNVTGDNGEDQTETSRVAAAYVAVAVVILLVAGLGAFLLLRGGDDEETGRESAHVNLESGQTNGVALDERLGPEPPDVEVADLADVAEEAGCELEEDLPIEGNLHLPKGASSPDYGTDPPTSGDHVEPPFMQADGAYIEEPEPMDVVHSLEHGRVAIQYSTELSSDEQLELRGLYDTVYAGALIFPNETMPFDVAASSWGALLGCPSYEGQATIDAIRAFGAEHSGKAPEPVDLFGPLRGPTFSEPS